MDFYYKSISKNIGKKISKNLIGKQSPGMLVISEKLFDNTKQSAADALTTSSKRVIQKTAGAFSDLIGNKIANKITKV